MKTRLWLVYFVILIAGCSVASNQDTVVGDNSDTSAEAQAKYKQEWLAAVKGKVWAGRPNVWGGGPTKFAGVFLFDTEGNLHNTDDDKGFGSFVPAKKYYSLHQVLSFHSGTQAVVKFYKSASPKLASEVYSLKISNGNLYRTDNVIDLAARGFSTISIWDGVSYSEENMQIFATNPTSTHSMYTYPTTPLTVPATNS